MKRSVMMALQIACGLVFVFIVYRVCLFAMDKDNMSVGTKVIDHSLEVKVVDGYAYMATLFDKQWNTVNQYSTNFLPIRPSYNRRGGIQFTYSFWLNMQNVQTSKVAWQDILLKGDAKTFKYGVTRFYDKAYVSATGTPSYTTNVQTVAVKCPRIRFGPTYDSLQVELNTLHNPDERFLIRSFDGQAPSGSLRNNALKLAQNKWVMVTFTFEDHVAINAHEDGILVSFYLNDTLYSSKGIKSAMRPNTASLHLFPSVDGNGTAITDSRIGNVFYYNRALTPQEVGKLFDKGFPKKPAGDSGLGEPLYLSEHNKADVYNT